jgi:hypothetical protein
MMSRYRLTAPIPAIQHAPRGAEIADLRVKLPAGAVLVESALEPTLFGMVDVYWEKRHYSVHGRDLFRKAELVSAA